MSSSDDDVPFIQRAQQARQQSTQNGAPPPKSTANGTAAQPPCEAAVNSDDDAPLIKRKEQLARSSPAPPQKKPPSKSKVTEGSKQQAANNTDDKKRKAQTQPASSPGPKRTRASDGPASGKPGQKMWTTLRHAGVLFPPEYEPHGVKMMYDGKPVELTKDQEEVASMFAVMLETDYMKKPVFLKNFWDGFKEVLGPKHVIKSLDKCDFRPMYDWHMAQREAKKLISKEEKARLKAEKDAAEAKFKVAYVDGREEPVGNFRVEPPGLFRGRGEHPKMGKIKKRIFPKDITINIGKGEPIPQHPYHGQTWKEVKHDQGVTWLAYWKDTISAKDYKYVFLGATSTFKADSDLAKYEKARKLKLIIDKVRKNYEADMASSDVQKQQMATALYFIDKLALRAGHEKDEDEADTVGCCTLKVENVEVMDKNQIKFDFLGKDSIRYENVVEVDPRVYKNIDKFRKVDQYGKKKKPGDQLFDTFDAQDLNKELKNIMDGLSVKVFRTYNASVVLDRLLTEVEESGEVGSLVDEKKATYDKANKEVAILCNHQRSVPKTHSTQMEKIQETLKKLKEELAELQAELKGKDKAGKEAVEKRIAKKQEQVTKADVQMRSKEDLKTVALGTSKINYMDPRITVAFCKRNEVPIEKLFNKSLLAKFAWAMEIEPEFRF